ncbi:MAG TPA: ATP-binding protein [Thermoanaerobaculia bacterium]|nr:ATP-binding protein [Thermoanaerobaculia bacterium]
MTLLAIVSALIAALALWCWGVTSRRARMLRSKRDEAASAMIDLRQREVQLQAENDSLHQIIDGLRDGLVAVDADRRVLFVNAPLLDMLGHPAGQAARTLGDLVRSAAVYGVLDAAISGSPSSDRFEIRVGSEDRVYEVHAFPLRSQAIAAAALFRDVTRLVDLESIRTNFISDFSHEAKTPLAALTSAVESFDLASERMSKSEEGQLRRIMSRQVVRLSRLVDDLAELSRIESGELTLNRVPVDLRSLVADGCEDFGERAAQKKLRFVISGDAGRVIADPMRLQQALSNLIDNAIKYGGEDSTIDVDIQRRSGWVAIRITDHGEGIAPEEREQIFRRFYRVDKSRSQEVAGSGLGLAITRHLVLQHGGSIEVESEPGRGSTFIVTLPEMESSPRKASD